eukprot:TRINITY_DN56880_c0_g1_i1.p1 TRINITY_DN56880_c0_g1~~TRINITY_DN56880_c0_g1_i1.p1  ORF type:complete len:444 (-),score=73.25 TRINITY_DN56880_c0_g1_i1:57-1268(-)
MAENAAAAATASSVVASEACRGGGAEEDPEVWQIIGARGRRSRGGKTEGSHARRAPRVLRGCGTVTAPPRLEKLRPLRQDEQPAVERCVARVRGAVGTLRDSRLASLTLEAVREAWHNASAAATLGGGAELTNSAEGATDGSASGCGVVGASSTVRGIVDGSPVSAGARGHEAASRVREIASEASPCGRILCLGVGSVEASAASQHQLALAALVAEDLGISDRLWADPMMEAVDAAVGEALGFTTVSNNGSCGLSGGLPGQAVAEAGAPLLLFMPHCDRDLYAAALAANLPRPVAISSSPNESQDRGKLANTNESRQTTSVSSPLARVVIIGNSFECYDQRSLQHGPTSSGHDNWQLLQSVLPILHEVLLPVYSSCAEAFNDMAVISFPASPGLAALNCGPSD